MPLTTFTGYEMHPHKHPHNFVSRTLYSAVVSSAYAWSAASTTLANMPRDNKLEATHGHARAPLARWIAPLITQRSVVQIHPRQPIHS